ncbi:MAG TPA: glycosyltransferase family 4 protein [Gaiellaceae bacterium]|jgi:glycosyltransferase involved in cell wall biosynthesis|nr:glycosyltransferase family 4 protein [Gaiellaceae bacterium]
MKVAIVTQFFPPETLAGANRVSAMASALAENAAVRVAAPAPSYPDPAAYAEAAPPELPEGVRLTRLAPFFGQRSSWARRAASELRMAGSLARAATADPVDVVIASSPSMFLGPAALAAARLRRAAFVWDVRDLTWEYGSDPSVIPGRAARTALAAVARAMWATARRADLVTCATPGLGGVLSERLPRQRVEVIPNGIDAALVASLDPSPPRTVDRLRVLYAGLVGHAQGLEVLLDVAAHLPSADITVVGDGPRRPQLEDEARRRRLENITFTGYVRPDRLVALYHDADVLFAQLQRSELHAVTAAPSKLLEYMAAGRPLVYAGEGTAAELVRAAGAGVVVEPGDAAAIAAAITSLGVEERLRLGRAARAFAEASPTRVDHMRRLTELLGMLE